MASRPALVVGFSVVVLAGHVLVLAGVTRPQSAGGPARTAVPVITLTLRESPQSIVQPQSDPKPIERAPAANGPGNAEPGVMQAKAPPSPIGNKAPHYRSRAEVDRPALPRSAPDTELLNGVIASGLPIRMRLFLSASGEVDDVVVLQAMDDDAEMVERLKGMLRSTAYVPARRDGRDVASFIDMEFSVSDL